MKNKRRLYGDAVEIEKLLSQTQLMETAEGSWASVHKEIGTGAFWLNCYATSATQGGGYQMLIRLPLPTTEELIDIAISSMFEDEAVAAILRLLDEEALERKDFRLRLIKKLEKYDLESLSIDEKKRFTSILKLAALDDPMNRRAIVGKSNSEVQQDSNYFIDVANKATALIAKLA